MNEQRPHARTLAVVGGIAGLALLAFGGATLLGKTDSPATRAATADLTVYNGVWVDQDGAWHRIFFKGDSGILRSQVVDVRFNLASRDKAAGADTFSAKEGLTGQGATAVFVLEVGQPKSLTISTDGSTSRLTYLKALTPSEAALLAAALSTPAKPLVEQLSPDDAPAAKASNSFAGSQTLDFISDATRKADLERQLTLQGYQDLVCVMGAESALTLEDGRYLTSTANAPPACGDITDAAFVFDTQTGRAAALIDHSAGGEDLQEKQYGDAGLVTWLQGRYADGSD